MAVTVPESLLEEIPLGWAYVKSEGKIRRPPHLCLIDKKLYQVAQGKLHRLRIHLPPGSYKTGTISEWFPAYLFDKNPELNIMLVGNNQDLATRSGRVVRDYVNTFGKYKIRKDVAAASQWLIEGHKGGMNCFGIGSKILGRRPNIIIIDDPIAKSHEVLSPTIREQTWDWYRTELLSRLEPGGSIIVVFQRWHVDDLAARIEKQALVTGEEWDELILPALAEENDPLGRKPGQALDPERYDEAAYEIIKGNQGFWWYAMYQQKPIPPEGQNVNPEWFRQVQTIPRIIRAVRAWDMAVAKPESQKHLGDYAAGALMVKDIDMRYGLLDMRRCKKSATGTELEMAHTIMRDFEFLNVLGYDKDWIEANYEFWFEKDRGGTGEISASYLVRRLLDVTNLPIKIQCELPKGPKEARADPMLSQAMAGNFWIWGEQMENRFGEMNSDNVSSNNIGKWDIQGLLGRIATFPDCDYDDEIDSMSMAFAKLLDIRGSGSHGLWL